MAGDDGRFMDRSRFAGLASLARSHKLTKVLLTPGPPVSMLEKGIGRFSPLWPISVCSVDAVKSTSLVFLLVEDALKDLRFSSIAAEKVPVLDNETEALGSQVLGKCLRFVVQDRHLFRRYRGKSEILQRVLDKKEDRQRALDGVHTEIGHKGRDATYALLKHRYWWPRCQEDLSQFVRSCQSCQAREPRRIHEPAVVTSHLRLFDK
ncbi:hypothetical protein N7535_001795 [Penicillium sp. DV-2018c]|nr:hypothetical protein N7461_004963 [Penicillium sp. DV-2018c]KAJ5583175.1 hypothetical protein N7535_001795 [Penicillium sp. DV-2018c]